MHTVYMSDEIESAIVLTTWDNSDAAGGADSGAEAPVYVKQMREEAKDIEFDALANEQRSVGKIPLRELQVSTLLRHELQNEAQPKNA